jgi:hypothetical protein
METNQPVTGYLLIETEYIPDEETTEWSKAFQEKTDLVNIEICKEIRKIVKAQCGYVRGAVVECLEGDSNLYNIIVSLEAEDDDTFTHITDQVRKITVTEFSEGHVKNVDQAKDKRLPTGLQGPP